MRPPGRTDRADPLARPRVDHGPPRADHTRAGHNRVGRQHAASQVINNDAAPVPVSHPVALVGPGLTKHRSPGHSALAIPPPAIPPQVIAPQVIAPLIMPRLVIPSLAAPLLAAPLAFPSTSPRRPAYTDR